VLLDRINLRRKKGLPRLLEAEVVVLEVLGEVLREQLVAEVVVLEEDSKVDV
jgi:hypothetical protein